MKFKIVFFVFFIAINYNFFSQKSTFVDSKGVFRWSKSKEEIRLFGVNYTLPFAHGFRAINYVN